MYFTWGLLIPASASDHPCLLTKNTLYVVYVLAQLLCLSCWNYTAHIKMLNKVNISRRTVQIGQYAMNTLLNVKVYPDSEYLLRIYSQGHFIQFYLDYHSCVTAAEIPLRLCLKSALYLAGFNSFGTATYEHMNVYCFQTQHWHRVHCAASAELRKLFSTGSLLIFDCIYWCRREENQHLSTDHVEPTQSNQACWLWIACMLSESGSFSNLKHMLHESTEPKVCPGHGPSSFLETR